MSSWLQKAPFGDSILARFRTSLPVKDEVDIDVCVESFHSHWEQAWTKMQAHQDGTVAVTMDEVNTVLNHTDQLRALVCWELEQQQGSLPGRLADLFLSNRVPERLLAWSSCCGQFEPLLQSELLRVFEQLLRAGGGSLLEQRALLRPLTALLVRCRSAPAAEQHRRLVLVLAQLCAALQARPALLDLFLGVEPDGSVSSCVVFSLLVEFVHSAGVVGATAREALLRCTRLSADSRPLAEFIVHHSDFCEVLATGLSGLYSALPRTPPAEDEDLPEVDAFVCSLQFCNSVLQTCHPMVSAVLLELVYQGFLVSVMGPALHQSSSEAVVTATTYLELCIRSVDHPGLVRALVRLLLRHRHDGVAVIDTLVQRIAATQRLAVATLSLLHTLLNLNCEDVLLELVLRHLLPCSHLMASQRSRVTETDLYGAGARRLLSLVPACCQPAAAADPRAAAAAWLQCVREARLALTACRLATSPFLLALLERLDRATTNSLQLNLLLMSVISRLAHYPQPLLRSLLLNPTLVCQPSVRSLIQTLGSLKHRIDLATRSVQDAPGLVRPVQGLTSGPASLPAQLGGAQTAAAASSEGEFRTSVGPDRPEWDASERRVALTAVLLEQWLAELAAVALEHSVATDRLVFAF
ncbi:FTS and Hook-interacting protein [Amphibalanus amphitrite]|uniref:FTS and Hook-interacting protein n=1 Tax=Amphibalanus amphitrite TaxID=1232801 RepID=A0A6A4VZ36_AMPAM|nr:FTS and Hook-interacting protein [Amphibalanus amphitrite]